MSAHNSITDIYAALTSGAANTLDPGPNGTFSLGGRFFSRVTLTQTGTYNLPNLTSEEHAKAYGTMLLVGCDDASTITLADGGGTFHVFTGTTGTTSVLCVYQGDNRWSGLRLDRASTEQSLGSVYTHLLSTQGFIDLPLDGWREVTTNDITNAAGNGGILATDTTPAYEYVNGDADSQHRLLWAAGNSDAVTRQRTLPPDLDRTQPIRIHVRGKMSDVNDSPTIDFDTFFDEGDTKVEDSTEALSDSVSNWIATIAAADVPDSASTMSIELTPGSHPSDTLEVYATWATYTKKLTS